MGGAVVKVCSAVDRMDSCIVGVVLADLLGSGVLM